MSTVNQQNVLVRSPYFPAINWGAIVAGVIVGLAVQLVLALLGVATGLSAVDVTEPGGGMGNAPLMAAAWQAGTMLIAAFIGGYVAARMSGLHRKSDGMLHGFVAWAATTLLFAALATSTVGGIFGSLRDTMARPAAQQGQVQGGPSPAMAQIEELIKGAGPNGGTNISADNMRVLQQHIQAGRREEAINHLVQSMGFERGRAETLVDQGLILAGSPERASPEAQSSANRTVETASIATWSIFAAVALSLLLGILGGLIGALSTRRRPRHAITHNY